MLLPFLFLFASAGTTSPDVDTSLKQFTEVLAAVETRAADPVNVEMAIFDGAIPAMLRELDPHSVFFNRDQFQQLQEMEHSESKGFGTIVSVLPGRVIVLQAMPGTPSARAGLSPGDEIVAVNNVALAALSFEQLVPFLTESKQKEAQLIVRRQGTARFLEFTLKPELMDSPTVERAFLLKPGIGYIRVGGFDPKTAAELKQAIEKLGGTKLNGLVLDLRNNAGGVVGAALETAGFFLKPGQEILTARGRGVPPQTVNVPAKAEPYGFRIVVLVNGKTASAAEIVSGALQDHDRAIVIGEPTYGKGLVQSIFPLAGSTALALTTSFYYTPSGRSIQRPLREGQLGDIATHRTYKTDSGRSVIGGGGITPDEMVQPDAPSRLRAVLEASGVITNFATEYIRDHRVAPDFAVTPELLDQFQLYAAERQISPSAAEWSGERQWLQQQLRVDIVTQTLGVEKGDELEMAMDPVVKAALEALAGELRVSR
jgi:carboxyl-terminal processing protease